MNRSNFRTACARILTPVLAPLLCAAVLLHGSLAQAYSQGKGKMSVAQATELFSKEQLSQSLVPCASQFPRGVPLNLAMFPAERQVTGLCSNHFAVISSKQTKTPLVVVERLTSAQLTDAKEESRTDVFFADPRLKSSDRAGLDDFRSSGFDRGHLSPAGNQPDQASMAQSFALSNMIPQDPTNNRKTWAKIESDVRKYVRRAQGNVFVYSGPLFRGDLQTIGFSRVWVPTHLFKLVYDETTGKAWAYILANTAEARVEAPVDYAEFVNQTSWQLLEASTGSYAARKIFK